MKRILFLVKDTNRPGRFAEAIRVAAGLSQHPELQVSLKLPLPLPPSFPTDHGDVFAEKGHGLYADAQWLSLLPLSLQKLHSISEQKMQTRDFDLFIPF